MGAGILIEALILAGLYLSGTDSLAVASSPKADSLVVGKRADTLRVRPMADSAPAWEIPIRSTAPGTALDQAFRDGQTAVPWRSIAELDGMWETWARWPGLLIDPAPVRLSWAGPSLAGASDAGPFSGRGIEKFTRTGMEGRASHWVVPLQVAPDTPSTALEFYRGALASYRFGMEFNRAVSGPWGVSVAMETRSAQSRYWMYRDQIQDMFQGSFGRGRGELPSHGRSAGQDDVQWQGVISRGGESSRLDFGLTWSDLRRGQPDPQKEWNDADRPVFPASQGRSGFFGRWNWQDPDWKLAMVARDVSEDWQWAALAVNGAPRLSEGKVDHLEWDGSVSRRFGSFEMGPVVQIGSRQGSQNAPGAIPRVDEDQQRAGLSATWTKPSFATRTEGGWTRLSSSDNRLTGAWDGQAKLAWGDSASLVGGEIGWSRQNRMPSEANLRADPLMQVIFRPEISPEATDLSQTNLRWRPVSFLTLDAGGAFLAVTDAWQPLTVPVAGKLTARRSAMSNANAGSVLGWTAQGGLSLRKAGWRARTEWSYAQRSLPGESPALQDPRWAQVHSRSNAGWTGKLLEGRVGLSIDGDLRTWSRRLAWVPVSDSLARGTELKASSQTDLEALVTIKTFTIQWRLENIFDELQAPAPGWNPLGIRAGWGITWSFGG